MWQKMETDHRETMFSTPTITNSIDQNSTTPQTPKTHKILDIEMTKNKQKYTTLQGKNIRHNNNPSIKKIMDLTKWEPSL